jgi:hypothetical protein
MRTNVDVDVVQNSPCTEKNLESQCIADYIDLKVGKT